MVQTPSAMVSLQTQMPEFSLSDAKGTLWNSADDSRGTLVIFMCNHCPFVKHVATLLEEIHTLCASSDIQIIGINSNDIEAYPDDSPEHMIESAARYNWTFPYLFDGTQEVAKAFQATCTPDVFLYDADSKLYYRGQFDDSRPSSGTADGHDLKNAIQGLIQGAPAPSDQKPAIGCNIKWKL
jgi:peroxiredoxin